MVTFHEERRTNEIATCNCLARRQTTNQPREKWIDNEGTLEWIFEEDEKNEGSIFSFSVQSDM